jgi:hypothetical protein
MYKDDGVEKLSEKTGDVAFVIQSLSKKKKNMMLMSYIQK